MLAHMTVPEDKFVGSHRRGTCRRDPGIGAFLAFRQMLYDTLSALTTRAMSQGRLLRN
jgi:hypothetical protein